MINELDSSVYELFAVGAIFIGSIAFVDFVLFLKEFSRELKYLNSEIRRSDGTEKRYWIQKKRRLWLSVLPFVRY